MMRAEADLANVWRSSGTDRPVRAYWYWPHPHRRVSPLLISALRPGDEFVVQALPSLHGEEFLPVAEYEVVRDLPDPTLFRAGVRRVLRPVELSYARSCSRRRLIRRGFDVGLIQLLVYQVDWLDLRAVRKRFPLVSVVHDVRPHVRSLPAGVEKALLRRLYREDCAGDLIVYSSLVRDELVADYGVEPDRVRVVPIPFNAFDLRRADVSPPQRPLVLFFGTLRPNKGLPVLLTALKQLPTDPGFDVVIAGAGNRATCETLTREAARLPFLSVELGFVNETRKAELYSQASLVVLPYTEFHSVSAVLADAYSYRIPVVASDVGSLGEAVTADATGWVVPRADPVGLADALTRAVAALSTERGRAAFVSRIGEAARRHHHSVVGPQYRHALAVAVERSTARPSR